MFEEIFIGKRFLPRMAGKIAKIRTRKNFVPHGNLQFLFEFCHFSHFIDKRQKNVTF